MNQALPNTTKKETCTTIASENLPKNLGYKVVKLPNGSLWPLVCLEELFVRNPSKVVEGWKTKYESNGYKQIEPKQWPKRGYTRARRELRVYEAW